MLACHQFEPIQTVEFRLLTSEVIRRLSVCECNQPTIYKKSLPREQSLNDTRLGPVNNSLLCSTCHNDMMTCNGHFGHIDLPVPMYHAMFLSQLIKILQCICIRCYQCVINLNDTRQQQLTDFRCVYQRCKIKKKCHYCGHVCTKYTNNIYAISSSEEQTFTAARALEIIQLCSRDTFQAMKLTVDPSTLILKTLIVPPVCVRQCIMFTDSSRARCQDDLTLKLQEILKQSIRLGKKIQQLDNGNIYENPTVQSYVQKLQIELSTYFNNEGTHQAYAPKKHSGLQEKCIIKRFKGKYGRIRGNLMGKRVDYSARTVISPGCHLDVDEVGIPQHIANTLTIPVRVTVYNKSHLELLMHQHKIKSVTNLKGQTQLLQYHQTHPKSLRIGHVVRRFLQNGDYVLVNRQPSLRKKSIMAHRAYIHSGKTIQLNLACTSAYNADFDGDEMNIHCPQDLLSRVEMSNLMAVEQQIMNAQNNKPILCIIQDNLVGCYKMTGPDVSVTKSDMCKYIMAIKYPCKPLTEFLQSHKHQNMTGKMLFSLTLPKSLCVKHGDFQIKKGVLIEGRITKKTMAYLIQCIHRLAQQPRQTIEFMTNCQYLSNAWMEDQGFSMGLGDCVLPEMERQHIRKLLTKKIRQIEAIDKMGTTVDSTLHENNMHHMLGQLLNQVGGFIEKQTLHNNAFHEMIAAGSKGSQINLAQVLTCVGQQSINGQRIHSTHPNTRTLSWLRQSETAQSLRGHGFVTSCYYDGLKPLEFFFHTMGGREGIVDTSVKTADTGYLQRKITKALEDVHVDHDFTVRNNDGHILDFVYGGDGCDAQYLTKLSMHHIRDISSLQTLENHCSCTEEFNTACSILGQCQQLLVSTTSSCVTYLPLDIDLHLLQYASEPSNNMLCPELIWKSTKYLLQFLEREQSNTLYLRGTIIYRMMSRKIQHSRQFKTETEYKNFIEMLCHRYKQSRIQPGEAVGILAAESVGHPCTQLTLNTFHFSGIASKNVTLGVPRIQELLNASKYHQSPLAMTRLNMLNSNMNQLRTKLIHTNLRQLLKSVDICRPDPITQTDDDAFLLHIQPRATRSSFFIRMEVCSKTCLALQYSFEQVRAFTEATLQKLCKFDVYMSASNSSMSKGLLHIHMYNYEHYRLQFNTQTNSGISKLEFEQHILHYVSDFLLESSICGVAGINDFSTDPQHDSTYIVHGSEFRKLWSIPELDWSHTSSNNPLVMNKYCGIEAALVTLYKEMKHVLSFDGSYIDHRHLVMICNVMTYRGTVLGLTRHGVIKHYSTLAKATFERGVDILLNAAIEDTKPLSIHHVSDNIMHGQRIPIGTGKSTLVTNPPELQRTRIKRISTKYAMFLSKNPKKRPRPSSPTSGTQKKRKPDPIIVDWGCGQQYDPCESPVYQPTSAPCSPVYVPTSPVFQDCVEPAKFPPEPHTYTSTNPSSPSFWANTEQRETIQPMAWCPSSPVWNTNHNWAPSSPDF